MSSEVKRCPIETTFEIVGKKWTIHILRDIFLGKKRFSLILEANTKLSTRILSLRLKEMERNELIKKHLVSMTPMRSEYELTEKGMALNNILYGFCEFSMQHFPDRVYKYPEQVSIPQEISSAKNFFLDIYPK